MKVRKGRPEISNLSVTLGQMARYAGGSKYVMDEKMKELARPVLEKAKKLIAPVFSYAIYDRSELDEETRFLLMGPVLEKFEKENDSPSVCVCLCTLGHELENAVGEMTKSGKALEAVFLDAAGVGFLESLGNSSFSSIREEAEKSGLFPGCRFEPGCGGISLGVQKLIFSLLNSSLVGVSLSDSCVMSPMKSLSFWMFFHETSQADAGLYKCGVCGLMDCPYRVMESMRHT